MIRKISREKTRGGIEIAEEAFNLVRTAPLHVISCYYIGSAPFVLGFLYFCSDMSRSAFAYRRCFEASLALAALFVWMKCWQSVFAVGLKRHITGNSGTTWTFRGLSRLIARQAAVQPYGLFLIPATMLLMLPFYSTHAFYQNMTVMEENNESDTAGLCRRAWKQALIWPKQNHVVIWLLSPWLLGLGLLIILSVAWVVVSLLPDLTGVVQELDTSRKYLLLFLSLVLLYQFAMPLSPFGCIVAGNIAIAMICAPMLIHFLFGIETTFTLGGVNGIVNTTFLLTVFGLSYLLLDPFNKAAHVLRCFYGESQNSGRDLLVELGTLEADGHGSKKEP